MILGHFAGNDGVSTVLVFGLAFAFLGVRRVLRGDRSRGYRWAGFGVLLLAGGIVSGLM